MTSKSKGRIKTVDELHRRYTKSEAAQFARSAEDLLRQAEGRTQSDVQPSGVEQQNIEAAEGSDNASHGSAPGESRRPSKP